MLGALLWSRAVFLDSGGLKQTQFHLTDLFLSEKSMLHKLFFRNGERAFTLVELLVVIAIIGILATIVLVSLNTARIRARDTKRLGDIRQIQLALELFADSHNQVYPQASMYATAACGAGVACGLASSDSCGSRQCMSTVPLDPTGTPPPQYWYNYSPATNPTAYHLGANLEEQSNSALNSDRDCNDGVAGGCGAAVFTTASGNPVGAVFGGAPEANTGCTGIAAISRYCYDVTN